VKLPKVIARCEASGTVDVDTALKMRQIFLPHRQCGIKILSIPEASHLAIILGSFAARHSVYPRTQWNEALQTDSPFSL
jgi:hypothetical protein